MPLTVFAWRLRQSLQYIFEAVRIGVNSCNDKVTRSTVVWRIFVDKSPNILPWFSLCGTKYAGITHFRLRSASEVWLGGLSIWAPDSKVVGGTPGRSAFS